MTDTLDRTPPHDADAEQATLGSVMMSPALLPDLRAVLDPADFYRPAHEQIWAAILALADRGHPFDMIAVGNELRIRGQVDKVGGPLYLHDLVSGVAVVSNAPHYATIIREHAERRRLIERLTRLQQEALSGRDLTVLREQIQTIADDQPRTSAGTTLERYPALNLADLLNPDRPPREFVVEGLLPAGASTSLVAPAGLGKSLFTLGLALAVARGDRAFAGLPIPCRRRVLYIDMENTEHDLAERMSDFGLTAADQIEGLIYLPLPTLPALDTPAGGRDLLAIVEAYGLTRHDLIVIDSLQRVTQGDENESDTMRAYYAHTAIHLKRLGLTVLRLDNTGKDVTRGSRGTSSKRDDVDLELIMLRDPDDETKFRIEPSKARLGDVTPLLMTRDTDARGTLRFSSVGDPFRAMVAECKDALDQMGFDPDSGYRPCMDALHRAGRRFSQRVVRVAVKERKGRSGVRKSALSTGDAPPHASGASDPSDAPRRTHADADEETRSDYVKRRYPGASREDDAPRRTDTVRGASRPSPSKRGTHPAVPTQNQEENAAPRRANGHPRLCEVCLQTMTDLGDGATTHPGCDSQEDPDACPF